MSLVPCSSWRWRLEASTTSKSTMPILPTPAAARYMAAGRAEAAGAQQEHARAEQLALAGPADLGQDEVPRVAGDLVGGEAAALCHLNSLYPGTLGPYS